MKLAKALFPAALFASVGIGIGAQISAAPSFSVPSMIASPDTVVYPVSGYKLRRNANLEEYKIADSLLAGQDNLLIADAEEEADTLPHLTARDTIKVPDSLRFTDPFRFKYYVAILDSLTHTIVRDSLQRSGDSLKVSSDTLFVHLDTLAARVDSLHAEQDWFDRRKLDTLYFRDSTARAKAAFEAWYWSLSKEDRKKYDYTKKEEAKMARRDSLDAIKDQKQALRDSIRENTPRVLDTYAIPDTMQFQRIIAWTLDRDFQDLAPFIPDTSSNYHFHDYQWQKRDVNVSWLGVPGSPVQYYNYFNRKNSTGVEFWEPNEAWTFNPESMLQYNSKTPHTELAYYGTLFSTSSKEADNVHILTTQNITPQTNFSLLYDRWGGGGMLVNETTKNKTFAAGINHLGKRYLANAGFISNSVIRGENGGIDDGVLGQGFWVRDTTVEVREYPVLMQSAKSEAKKMTVYADQQLRIPFEFINKLRAKADTTFKATDSTDVTTAFIGHAIEYSTFKREYYTNSTSRQDSLGQTRLDNKIYLRLQPWSEDAFISKLDVGLGDYLHKYNKITDEGNSNLFENSLYAYAGAGGKVGKHFDWGARAHSVFAGADAGNTDLSGHLEFRFYPWRKARTSPVCLGAQASTSLLNPTFTQRYSHTTNFKWDNDFSMISTSKIEGTLDIPYLKMNARAGYALLSGNLYYDTSSIIRQNSSAMSVISACLRKEFAFGDFLHLDNRLLAQYSSNQDVLPLPALSANLRWYIQFPVEPGVMDMQLGVDMWANTEWNAPAWNPELGVFYNQNEAKYTNGPFFDAFVNIQWKTCCLFIKAQNLGEGWPLDRPDYFSAHNYIITNGGATGLKIGIWWPFYTSPTRNRKAVSK